MLLASYDCCEWSSANTKGKYRTIVTCATEAACREEYLVLVAIIRSAQLPYSLGPSEKATRVYEG